MLLSKILNRKCGMVLLSLACATAVQSQVGGRVTPVWWFGQSAAANFNNYRGTTQRLTTGFSVPSAFHKANSVRPYFSLLAEYRPNKIWGGMLNIAYDNRGGTFNTVMAPCNCPADLSTNLTYIAIEPSLRIAPFSSPFYIFGGPTMGINVRKEFTYVQEKQEDRTADIGDIRKTVFSAQAGLGVDIPVSAKDSRAQMTLSPFASFQSSLGQAPRTIESWSVYTVRAGIALKFGSGRKTKTVKSSPQPTGVVTQPAEREVLFSVRAPLAVPGTRQVKENFPLLNSVFFNAGSAGIPDRYILLDHAAATAFRETQLQSAQPDNLNNNRAGRQLSVYYNILNILGDRMRSNPAAMITLSGAAEGNPAEGKLMAENIKQYLVTVFGINAARIGTEGRDKPVIPSGQPGGTRELSLLREEDRRVDITTVSPELLLQVGGNSSFLKPVQISAVQWDPLDSHVIFTCAGALELLKWWSLELTDANGVVQRYGPFAKEVITIPGKQILGNSNTGSYQVTMIGESYSGRPIRKESSVRLIKAAEDKQTGMRYSILFGFDRSQSVIAYEKFLAEVVAPLISDYGTVIIHGHTDVIGEENYNRNVSQERAAGSQKILERSTAKKGVKFESYGFGEDNGLAPFDNKFPEERFYNRTVIIDIIAAK